MKIKILKHRYHFEYAHLRDQAGYCTDPDAPNKKIRVDKKLQGEDKLEICIHEFTHGAFYSLSEETVVEFSKDLARFLTRLGVVWENET